MTEHGLDAISTHSRWNRALPPRLEIDPGDTVHFRCVEAAGGQVHPGTLLEELSRIDRGRVHSLTGPVFVRGAQPGDVLEIEILDLTHHGWGYSTIVEGLGFLKAVSYTHLKVFAFWNAAPGLPTARRSSTAPAHVSSIVAASQPMIES